MSSDFNFFISKNTIWTNRTTEDTVRIKHKTVQVDHSQLLNGGNYYYIQYFFFFFFFFWKAQTVYCILCINSNSHYVIYHCTTRVCQSFVHTVHNTFIILKNNSHDTQLWVAKTTFDKIMLRYLIAKKWYRSPGGMFSHFHPKNLIQLL